MNVFTKDSNKIKKAQADGDADEAVCVGICVNAAETGQPVLYVSAGDITIGATVQTGTIYVVSANAGKIAPVDDLVSGNHVSVLGVAKSTTQLTLQLWNTAIAKD